MDLHVTNIAPTVTEIELRAVFARVVPVESVTLLPGGDALVSFKTDDDARRAEQELDGAVVAGSAISLHYALPRRERQDRNKLQGEASEER